MELIPGCQGKRDDELGCIRLVPVWERGHYRPELQMVPVSLDLDLTHAALLLLQTNYSERIELKVSDGKNAPGCAVRLSLDHMKEEGTITLYTLGM